MGIRSDLETTRDVGRVLRSRLGDRLGRSAATPVPLSADELTLDWLTDALCTQVASACVTGIEIGHRSSGTSMREQLTVAYNDEGKAAGLPTQIYAKSTPSVVNRLLLGITGAAAAEARFYETIRRDLNIGTPDGYHGSSDSRSGRSMILMEDIGRTRQAVFGDATTLTVSRAEAEQMVDEMAQYHGAMWEDPRLDGGWPEVTDARSWQQVFNAKTRMDRGAVLMVKRLSDLLPVELIDRRGEIRSAFAAALDRNVAAPATLLHQDVHPANWFRTPDGGVHLYDWQAIAGGHWALDVSYALSSCLTVDDRREWERDLIAHYLDRLRQHGGKPEPFDDAFLAYRQQMLHGLVFWLYTSLVGKVAPLQPHDHTALLVQRTSQAVIDLEVLDAI